MSTNDVLIERAGPSNGSEACGPSQRALAVRPGPPGFLSFLPGLMAIGDWCGIMVAGWLANLLAGQPAAAIPSLALVLVATLAVDFTHLFGGYSRRSGLSPGGL